MERSRTVSVTAVAPCRDEDEEGDDVVVQSHEVQLLEKVDSGYANFTWHSALLLAHWLAHEVQSGELNPVAETVLELGCGTALPGLFAAKCGATVILTDAATETEVLQRASRAAELNGVADRVSVQPWTWGQWDEAVLTLNPTPTLVLAADCLYSLEDYEPFFATASDLLHRGPKQARLLLAYSDRVAGRSMQPFLWRWHLLCRQLEYAEVLPEDVWTEAEGKITLLELRCDDRG